jgi:hypothetical protein
MIRRSLLLVVLTALLARPALAALGADEASVEADAAKMQGSDRITRRDNYAIHEIQTPSGIIVREYVALSGKVFAVAWRGPRHPDTKQILGEHFERYGRAARAAHRRPIVVDDADLVIRSGGHMRAFFGEAYLPRLLPEGVRIEELR